MRIIHERQRGVSLIITFFVMSVVLAIVLNITVILFSEITIIRNVGDSVPAYFIAESGIEKTLYADRKQIPDGGTRGICNLCNLCPDCNNCQAAPLVGNGCAVTSCTHCEVKYDGVVDDKTYSVKAVVAPDDSTPGVYIFTLEAIGFYKQATRAVQSITRR